MPESYYPEPDDQIPDTGKEVSEQPGTESEPSTEESEAGADIALIPKTLFKDAAIEPGQIFTFKVTHVYEDEVAVEKVSEEEQGEKPITETATTAENEIDMLANTQTK